jgi:hypothetical protein
MSPRRILSLVATATALLFAAPAFATLPIIDYSVTGPAGDNGWYVGPVTVKWTLLNELSSSGCDTQTLTADTAGTQITCTASNLSGPVSGTTVPIRIDQTAPADVTAAAARAPDAKSWFTAPVGITWSGNDALSGIASCTALSYAGPDATGATPTGTCRDRAGNVSSPVGFSLDYDATAPALTDVTATTGPGRADIRWAAGADAVRVTVVRESPGAGVPAKTVADLPAATTAADTDLAPATTYTWTVTAVDAAGNAASQRATATTPLALTQPAGGTAGKSAKPRAIQLRWSKVRGAGYYNIQVFRGHRKVLSAWPARARFRVAASWRYRGRTERLVAGRTYRWYAWAGFGVRSAHRYGRLLAHGRFTVPAKAG